MNYVVTSDHHLRLRVLVSLSCLFVFCIVSARYPPCSLCRLFCVVSFRVVYFVLNFCRISTVNSKQPPAKLQISYLRAVYSDHHRFSVRQQKHAGCPANL